MRTGCEAHLGTFHPIGPLLLWFIFFLGLIQIIPPMLFVYFWENMKSILFYIFSILFVPDIQGFLVLSIHLTAHHLLSEHLLNQAI